MRQTLDDINGSHLEPPGRPGRRGAGILAAALVLLATAPEARARVALPPPGDTSVHDWAGVISAEHARTMERIDKDLFDKTGVAIVVVTVPRLEGEPIEDFAVRVGSEWGAGKKGEDRGIVVAFALAERRIFVATGYGVEGFLPDGRVGGILDHYIIPLLKTGDYSLGLMRACQALVATAAEEYGVTIDGVPSGGGGRRGTRSDQGPGFIGTVLIVLLVIFVIYLFVRHPLLAMIFLSGRGSRGGRFGGGFGAGGFGGGGFGGFGGGGFGGGGAGRGF